MKPLFVILSVVIVALHLNAQTSVLHLNINSHNEENDPIDYLTLAGHDQQRALVKQLADSVIAKQIKWNMQVDANFIRGTLINDTAFTNPNDILQWADNSPYIEVDVHNHFVFPSNLYNIADVAHLLDSCGLSAPRNNNGGMLWDSTDWGSAQDHWTQWQNGVNGFAYPTYNWQPKIIATGGGSPGHTNDINCFGFWKPSGANGIAQFTAHDQNKNLIVIGNGCNWVIHDTTTNPMWIANDIIAHMNYFASTPVTSNTFYNAIIQTNFRHYSSANYIDKVMTVINALLPYGPSGTGQIIWETHTEKYNSWYASHSNAQSFFLDCANVVIGMDEEDNSSDEISVYPNPFSETAVLRITNQNELRIEDIKICDVVGQEFHPAIIRNSDVPAGQANSFILTSGNLASGIYLLKTGNTARKIVVSR